MASTIRTFGLAARALSTNRFMVSTRPTSAPSHPRSLKPSSTSSRSGSWGKAREALVQGERDALAGFSPEEQSQLLDMLKRVAMNIDQAIART
ncbi:hypothetical protein [Streptomyces sp. PSKA30]|uniref:hypothetical protein n=1 Tax=Streptomyces sp. PSKA30 TaxID=2874597 RepID=UPI001CD0450B|nr:hypothetical protein [Streptomyces sp. PSKA30]MBZ9644112.1 hypothetical protein [Streptomyces sp. PSKA30]